MNGLCIGTGFMMLVTGKIEIALGLALVANIATHLMVLLQTNNP